MKKILICTVLGAITLAGCQKDEAALEAISHSQSSNEIYTKDYKAAMSGEQEVPTHSSNGIGSFDATYTASTGKMDYVLTFTAVPGTEFKPTVAHIHKGMRGENGNSEIIFDLGTITSSRMTGSITLTQAQLQDMNKGAYYVHMHSNVFPEGDIRGQIEK